MIGFSRSPGRPSMASAHSLSQFQKAFSDEASCAAFMFKRRWPDGFVCPACGKRQAAALKSRPRLHECLDCGRQTSVTAGTVMHRSRLPLTTWFWAAHLMTTHSNGMSALQLQDQLGVTYKTAWGEPGSIEFLVAYQSALEQGASLKIGSSRSKPGTIAWLVAEYLGSVDFAKRPASIQQKHRPHLERFRVEHGDRTVAGLDAERIERLQIRFITAKGGHAAANQWLDCVRDLLNYALRKKVIAASPAAQVKKL